LFNDVQFSHSRRDSVSFNARFEFIQRIVFFSFNARSIDLSARSRDLAKRRIARFIRHRATRNDDE